MKALPVLLALLVLAGPALAQTAHETPETLPELIGGLHGLQARLVYPEAARRAGVEGTVLVQVVVGRGGGVRDAFALRSPDPLLSEAALDAVRASQFRPGSLGGRPVQVEFALPVTFRLAPPDPGAVLEGADRDSGPTAPPSAADSALVERYLALSADGVSTSVSLFDDAPGPFGALVETVSGAGLDSTRAVLYRDLRPALLAEALAFLEGPVSERVQRESGFTADSLSLAQMQALLADPGDRPLADSALAARYAAALLAATQPPDVQERMADLLISAFPADMLDAAGGADAFRELYLSQTQSAEIRALQLDTMTRAGRLGLAGLDEADVRALTAFYESDAARYVSRAAALGAANALAPRMAEVMASALAAQALAPDAAPPRPDEGAAPPADGRVYEAAEVPPELVGGLAALQARATYPEAARRAGAEGTVVVQFVVDEGGAVTDPVVLSAPDSLLAAAAVEAVRASSFTPGTVGGEPVRVRFAVPVRFVLRDEPTPTPPARAVTFRVEYPESARREGVEGRVVVSLGVDGAGRAVDPAVVSSPDERLSEAALDAVREAQFVGGAETSERFEIPVTFSLDPEAYDRPAPVVGADGVYETAEVQPELIGGLRGLQERVEYPEDARQAGIQGQVVVQFVVDEGGKVRDVTVLRSPDLALSAAALRAVRRSRFKPGTVGGEPVRVRFAVPVTFRLR